MDKLASAEIRRAKRWLLVHQAWLAISVLLPACMMAGGKLAAGEPISWMAVGWLLVFTAWPAMTATELWKSRQKLNTTILTAMLAEQNRELRQMLERLRGEDEAKSENTP